MDLLRATVLLVLTNLLVECLERASKCQSPADLRLVLEFQKELLLRLHNIGENRMMSASTYQTQEW